MKFKPLLSKPYSAWAFFGVPGPCVRGGGEASTPPPPLPKSESIDTIVMKLGG